jgi:hypothetical protein
VDRCCEILFAPVIPNAMSRVPVWAKEQFMRKIIYGAGTSLDGYIARLDGSLDFLHVRPSNYSMGPFFKTN